MKIETFEDIISWQKAKVFSGDVYKVFSKVKDYGFKDQISKSGRICDEQYCRGVRERMRQRI